MTIQTTIKGNKTLELYKKLLIPRLIEKKMLLALRQGKISKWFSAWGQEAISVGVTQALRQDEFILTMHRNLGVFTSRNVPLDRLFAQFQAKKEGFTQGRDRSFHFGTQEHYIVGMISHLGSQMGVAAGIALANKLHKTKKATVVFTGDGGTSEGDFHEAMNLAAVWDLPMIVIIENNQWGLSTPSNQQFKCKQLADRAIGYGIEGITIDGNNYLEVYETVKRYAQEIRENPRPIIIECNTFRMRGHEEASGTKYYPEGMIESWEDKDPIVQFENKLKSEGLLTDSKIEQLKQEITQNIEENYTKALNFPDVEVNLEKEIKEVYHDFQSEVSLPSRTKTKEIRYIDAISEALDLAMNKYDDLVLMGQDIADYGGAFKITDGFLKKYGKDRVRNTPITEAAVLGASLGMSVMGVKTMVEMQFSDFASEGFNQIVNNLAKSHYRWGQNADVVVRMPTGGGTGAGPFHSQSIEAWFTHVPGLKIVCPAFASDAKGLLLRAFKDPNPVLFFEHKKLYRSLKEEVIEDYYEIEFGKANLVQKGEDLTIISYGMGVHWAIETLENHPNIKADLIDLRTLVPLDFEAIKKSIAKTNKVIILQEATQFSGFGAELSAQISEHCFSHLDAPILRCGSLDTPIPFNLKLEEQFLPKKRFEEQLIKLYNF